ncbi:hypothetical protein X975_22508, partial [Stegodyphus mimosarum]
MGFGSLILLSLVAHAANAMYPMEYVELSRLPAATKFDSSEDIFAIRKSDDDSDYDDSSSSESDETKAEFRSDESDFNFSNSRRNKWTDRDSNESNKYDDSEENDALFSSESSAKTKRDDYYDNLGKKSKRSFYISPLRNEKEDESEEKIRYANAGGEHYVAEESSSHRSKSSKFSDYDAYYPQKNGNAESQSYNHQIREDSYQASSSRHIPQSALPLRTESLQDPPARRASRHRRYHPRPRPIPIDGITSVENSEPRNIYPYPHSSKPAPQVQRRRYVKKHSSKRPAESYARQSYTYDGTTFTNRRPKPLGKESRDVAPKYSVHA